MKKYIVAVVLFMISVSKVAFSNSTYSIQEIADEVVQNRAVYILPSNFPYTDNIAYISFITKGLRYTILSNPHERYFEVWVRKNGTTAAIHRSKFSFSSEVHVSNGKIIFNCFPDNCNFVQIAKAVSARGEMLIYNKGRELTKGFSERNALAFCNIHIANIAEYYSL